MNIKFIISIAVVIILNVKCEDKILAINCKLSKAIFQPIANNWKNVNETINCPLNDKTILRICKYVYADNGFKNILPVRSIISYKSCFSGKCDEIRDLNYQFYKCLKIHNVIKPLDVQDDCIFNHTVDECLIGSVWKDKASNICRSSNAEIEFELFQLMGIFPCITAFNENVLNFKGIQFVCCPKIKTYEWYMKYVSYHNGTIESELLAYTSAKRSLRNKFKIRQQRITDRYVLEEKSINMWSNQPKLAKSIERDAKKRFQKSFMFEMNKEVDLLRELELVHENKMQMLFEKIRKDSKSRLEYTLQETNLEISRVAMALKLELDSILSEANDTLDFLERYYAENLDDDKRNKELIKQNFNNLIIQSWEDVINLVKKKNLLKGDVLKQIENSELKRKIFISRFKYLNINYIPKNSMKSQAENYMKNIITGMEHEKYLKNDKKFGIKISNIGGDSQIVAAILICLLVVLAILIAFIVGFCFHHYFKKMMFRLINVFKKIHPRTKNVFVQIENYPFKNRYNYGNNISKTQCKTEESVIGISSGYNCQFNLIKNSLENIKKIDQDYCDHSISNINGLENPICRLLDEK